MILTKTCAKYGGCQAGVSEGLDYRIAFIRGLLFSMDEEGENKKWPQLLSGPWEVLYGR
jgi:hypothetical protein